MRVAKNTTSKASKPDKSGKLQKRSTTTNIGKPIKQSRNGKPGKVVATAKVVVSTVPKILRPIHAPKPEPAILHYFVIYKPFGMMSQFSVENDKPVLANLAHRFPKDVYPVEPINADSEGLIILSNDRALKQQMLDASKKTAKTYLLQVEGDVTDEALKTLSQGVTISVEGNAIKAPKVKVRIIEKPFWIADRIPTVRYRKSVPETWLELSIVEGKNSHVRRMTAAVGFPTLRLIRIGIGKLWLTDMKQGEVKEVKREDLDKAF